MCCGMAWRTEENGHDSDFLAFWWRDGAWEDLVLLVVVRVDRSILPSEVLGAAMALKE